MESVVRRANCGFTTYRHQRGDPIPDCPLEHKAGGRLDRGANGGFDENPNRSPNAAFHPQLLQQSDFGHYASSLCGHERVATLGIERAAGRIPQAIPADLSGAGSEKCPAIKNYAGFKIG